MKARLLLLVAALCALSGTPLYAWDELGHRVIARIAWDHMTPAARARAATMLLVAPPRSGLAALQPGSGPTEERMREWFVMSSYWPDLIRSPSHPGHVYGHSDWHYVNIFWEQRPGGPLARPDLPRAGFLLDQVKRMATSLADPATPDSAKAVDLAWALHLVGDLHQPLHNSARITAEDPKGDQGGNLFRLAGMYPYNNLHAVWDALIGPAYPWRASDRDEADYVGGIAEAVTKRWPLSSVQRRVLPGQFDTWAQEGARVAQTTGYPSWLQRNQRAPARYHAHAWSAAAPRVALAGYRLAAMLNAAFD